MTDTTPAPELRATPGTHGGGGRARALLLTAGLLVLSAGLAALLLRILAFDFLVETATRLWSRDGAVSPAAEALLGKVLIAGALGLMMFGSFLAALANRTLRRRFAAAVLWDPLRASGLTTPNPVYILACSVALGLSVIALWHLKGRAGGVSFLFTKEGPLEIATFLLEIAGAAFCTVAAVRWRRCVSGFPRSVPLLFALCAFALFMVGMEEINWGQTFIPFATPAGWAAINYQQETSLHNLVDRDTLTAAWKLVSPAFVLAAVGLVAWSARSPRSTVGAIAPHSSLIPLALLAGYAGLRLHPEMIELLLALFFAFYAYRIHVAALSGAGRRPRLIGSGVRVLIALGLVAGLLIRVDWTQVSLNVAQISLPGLSIVFALMCLGLVISAWKWSQSLRMHDLLYPFPYVLRALATGFFINNFLPTAIGGDAYRVYRTLPRDRYRSRALSAVAVERSMGFFVLLALGSVAALTLIDQFDAARVYCIALLTVTLAGIAAFVALEKGWFRNAAQRSAMRVAEAVRHNLALLHNRKGNWLVLAAQSLLFQVISIGILFILFQLVGAEQVGPARCALIAAVTGVAVILPISINGLGVMEGTIVATATAVGVDYEQALVVAFARRLIATLLGAACGTWYLIETHRTRAATGRQSLLELLGAIRRDGGSAAWATLRPNAAIADVQGGRQGRSASGAR